MTTDQAVDALMKLADDYAFSFVNDCDEKRAALRTAIAAALAAERERALEDAIESAMQQAAPADQHPSQQDIYDAACQGAFIAKWKCMHATGQHTKIRMFVNANDIAEIVTRELLNAQAKKGGA